MIIRTHAELLAASAPLDSSASKKVQTILETSDRAASITRQLLAFSRQQVFERKVLDLRTALKDMAPMLSSLLRSDIQLDMYLDSEPTLVQADLGQITQVMMNLAANARDAMPHGGRLAVTCGSVILNPQFAEELELSGRNFVLLTVADSGQGMTAEEKARAFEPFFTTKERGKGHGAWPGDRGWHHSPMCRACRAR